MSYHETRIGLSRAQIERLARAIETETPLSFTKYEPEGATPVYLTREQMETLGAKPLKFGKRQLAFMAKTGGFLGALLKSIIPVLSTVGKVVGPALATGALTGAANYGAQRILKKATGDKTGRGFRLAPYKRGKGFRLAPHQRGEGFRLAPHQRGGFIGTVLATALSSLLPGIISSFTGKGLTETEASCCRELLLDLPRSKKSPEAELNRIVRKYGSGLVGKLLGLPQGKIPVLSDIPLLGALF